MSAVLYLTCCSTAFKTAVTAEFIKNSKVNILKTLKDIPIL